MSIETTTPIAASKIVSKIVVRDTTRAFRDVRYLVGFGC
jgi:hypothetical protein